MMGKRKAEKADSRGGGFFLLPQCLLNSEALRTASPRAIKVLLALCAKHNGFNNGAIGLGFRELAEWLNSQNHAATSRALCQLIERGLVTLERDYPRGQRLAREYRLTFVPAGDDPATNDYLNWKPGDAGTCRKRPRGNFRVEATATRSAVRVEATATGVETSRCDNRNGVHQKPPFLGSSPVAIPTTHIANHLRVCPSSSRRSVPNGDGPLSAAPDPEELRGRVLAVLDEAGRGSQGQLAAMASIRPAALSKFLNHSGPLDDLARVRLTCALPRLGVPIPEGLPA
jgi:hypothetical protein